MQAQLNKIFPFLVSLFTTHAYAFIIHAIAVFPFREIGTRLTPINKTKTISDIIRWFHFPVMSPQKEQSQERLRCT